MKNLLLIYNPNSGEKLFKYDLDACINIFQSNNICVSIYRISSKNGLINYFKNIQKDYFDTIVVSGGDGTINSVVNCIIYNNINCKIGIIPSGTANDFSMHLRLPRDVVDCAKVICDGKTILSDVGMANDTYFINVFAGGLLTNISQKIDSDFKDLFGKMAYYLKGIEQIPNFVPIKVKITNSSEVIIEDIYLFIILNSKGTGGFENLAVDASICDGVFDFIAVKATPFVELAILFIKILKGEHLDDPNIIYFKDSFIEIENQSTVNIIDETDVDGEDGPSLPVKVINIKNRLQIIVPSN